MQGFHHFGQFGEVKANFGSCGKVVQSEVDSISTRFDGGLQFGPLLTVHSVTSGSQKRQQQLDYLA